MAVHDLSTVPGSGDITGEYTVPESADVSGGFLEAIRHNDYVESRFRGESGGPLLIDKITELLHKEFGQMPLRVSIAPMDMDRCYKIEVRYGREGKHYIGINITRQTLRENIDNYGLKMVARVTAGQLIRHIGRNVRDTMFGFEIKETTPQKKKVKEEPAFRKILI